MPTIGFNVETLKYKKTSLTVWDVGGQQRIRTLWRHYYQNTQGLIYVVDSSDKDRLAESAEELQAILSAEDMADAKVLVYANKQDVTGAATSKQVAEALGLSKDRRRQWYVQGSSAKSGDGLYEGLDWLTTSIKQK